MKRFTTKKVGIFVIATLANMSIQAQDLNRQSSAAEQRMYEMQLLEQYAQEQALQQQNINQNTQAPAQNVSLNQPYQPAPAVTAPERQDLFDAANAGNIQQIKKLLSQGMDINVYNDQRETALHMAAARGHYQAVIFLVKSGAYVNAPTVKNWIPLHHAVRFRHPNIVNFLVQRGSSPQARTSDGLTAVDMARNNRDYRLMSIMGAR